MDDAPVLAHHRAAMFVDMGSLEASQAESLEREARPAIADLMGRGEYLGWKAMAGDDCVGGAGVLLRPLLPRPLGKSTIAGPEAIILNVYVEPAWRRRGIARRLMDVVMASLEQRGVKRIVLHASAERRALYEEIGFRPTNEMLYHP